MDNGPFRGTNCIFTLGIRLKFHTQKPLLTLQEKQYKSKDIHQQLSISMPHGLCITTVLQEVGPARHRKLRPNVSRILLISTSTSIAFLLRRYILRKCCTIDDEHRWSHEDTLNDSLRLDLFQLAKPISIFHLLVMKYAHGHYTVFAIFPSRTC